MKKFLYNNLGLICIMAGFVIAAIVLNYYYPIKDIFKAKPETTKDDVPQDTTDGNIVVDTDRNLVYAYLTAFFGGLSEYMKKQTTPFLQAWVEGLKNNQESFYFNYSYYNTQTGQKQN